MTLTYFPVHSFLLNQVDQNQTTLTYFPVHSFLLNQVDQNQTTMMRQHAGQQSREERASPLFQTVALRLQHDHYPRRELHVLVNL
jgi:hypothetical protein